MPHETGTSLTLNPRVAILLLAATATALVVIGTAGQLLTYVWNHNTVFGLVRLFDLSGEGNIPVAFSALLLFLVSLSLALIAALSPAVGPLRSSRWAILSCGFLWMVADEWFELHERLVFPVQGLLGSGPLAYASRARLTLSVERALRNNPGSDLLSHTPAHAVPSAVAGLTSVFGMGTGGTLPL